jgi:hypothetical protein
VKDAVNGLPVGVDYNHESVSIPEQSSLL